MLGAIGATLLVLKEAANKGRFALWAFLVFFFADVERKRHYFFSRMAADPGLFLQYQLGQGLTTYVAFVRRCPALYPHLNRRVGF